MDDSIDFSKNKLRAKLRWGGANRGIRENADFMCSSMSIHIFAKNSKKFRYSDKNII